MRANRPSTGADAAGQLELFDGALAEPGRARGEPVVARDRPRRSNANLEAVPIESAEPSEPAGGGLHAGSDRAALAALEAALLDARSSAGRRSLASAGARRLAASARGPAEERERDRGVPGRDRRPARVVGSERAQRPRGGDDRRLPALVPATRGPCAGHLLPALSPPAQVPPMGQPTRRRPRPIRGPRAAAEAPAGAGLVDSRRVPTPTRRRGPARAEPARARRARSPRIARPRHDGTPPLRALRARMARPRARRTEAFAACPPREGRQVSTSAAAGSPRP